MKYQIDQCELAACKAWAVQLIESSPNREPYWTVANFTAGKMAEVAVSSRLGVCPSFRYGPDGGIDIRWHGLRLDIKSTYNATHNLCLAESVRPGAADLFIACHVDRGTNVVSVWGWQLAAYVFADAELKPGKRPYRIYQRSLLVPGVPVITEVSREVERLKKVFPF